MNYSDYMDITINGSFNAPALVKLYGLASVLWSNIHSFNKKHTDNGYVAIVFPRNSDDYLKVFRCIGDKDTLCALRDFLRESVNIRLGYGAIYSLKDTSDVFIACIRNRGMEKTLRSYSVKKQLQATKIRHIDNKEHDLLEREKRRMRRLSMLADRPIDNIVLKSTSTGQNFSLFYENVFNKEEVNGEINSYGLSKASNPKSFPL